MHPKKLTLAMALRGTTKHYRFCDIQRRHFNGTAARCGLGVNMEPIITDVIANTPRVIERVGRRLPKGFPPTLFASVTRGLRKAAAAMEAMAIE